MTSTGWQNRYSAAAPDLRADEIRVLPNLYSVRYSSCKNCWVNPEIDVSLSLQSIMLKVQPNIYLQLVSSFPLLFPKIRPSRAHAYCSEIHLKMSEELEFKRRPIPRVHSRGRPGERSSGSEAWNSDFVIFLHKEFPGNTPGKMMWLLNSTSAITARNQESSNWTRAPINRRKKGWCH